MSDDAQEWRWVGEDGVQKTVLEPELISGLSGETLPNYTLVWRRGWLEWLPAMQIEELAWALPPGKADEATRAREGASGDTPPAPPLYRYAVLKRRASSLRADRGSTKAAVIPRPVVKKAPDAALLAAVSSDAKPKPIPSPSIDSRPLEEEEEEEDMAAIEAPIVATSARPTGGHLSPPASAPDEAEEVDAMGEGDDEGALDEAEPVEPELDSAPSMPSSPMARRAYGEEDDAETRVLPSVPPPGGPTYVPPHAPPASEHAPARADLDPHLGDDMPRIPRPPRSPADLGEYDAQLRGSAAEGAPSSSALRYPVIAGTLAVVAVGILFWLFRSETGGEGEVTSGAPSASAGMETGGPEGAPRAAGSATAAPVARTPTGAPCSLLMPASRVADFAEPAVLQSFAPIPGSSRIALGFGQTDTYAIGITIDPRTLDRDQVFREARTARLVSVVPTAGAGKLQFQVVRSEHVLSNARGVDAATPFVIGATENSVSRQVGRASPEVIWELEGAKAMTVPRVATVPSLGHAVAFRRGGRAGKVAFGWLDPDGRRRTSLSDVAMPGDFAGTPSLAASETGILLAFAVRSEATEEWALALSTADHGSIPRNATRFALPPGGPGGDVISPSVAALSDGRWLLQWTEGRTGQRVVRIQVLDRKLEPFSRALSVSPEGVNAGQGAAWASGSVAAVLFYVQNEQKSHELWGASVECPRSSGRTP